jgi:hypothetical protein
MGRGRKARTVGVTTNVIGPTPTTENAPFGVAAMQHRAAAQDDLLGLGGAGARAGQGRRGREPAKMRVAAFYTAPPRTELMPGIDDRGAAPGAGGGGDDAGGGSARGDTFKRRAGAPANLGEIAGSECLLRADAVPGCMGDGGGGCSAAVAIWGVCGGRCAIWPA